MDGPANDSLERVFQDVVGLLEALKVPYLIIGGVAQAVIGEPRLTQDVDSIVAIESSALHALLEGFERTGFEVDHPAIQQRVETTGTFSIRRGRWRVDLILASTEFERSAFRRAQRLSLYGVKVNLPTPEDLILLKLVPGRDKDLLDVKTIMIRHLDRLDRPYLEQWAQRFSDEAGEARSTCSMSTSLWLCGHSVFLWCRKACLQNLSTDSRLAAHSSMLTSGYL